MINFGSRATRSRAYSVASLFALRGQSNLSALRRYSRPVDLPTGLICDPSLVLTGTYAKKEFEAPLRRIRLKDLKTDRTLSLVTKDFRLPADTLIERYRCHGQVT